MGALCVVALLGAAGPRDEVEALRSQARRQMAAAYRRIAAHGPRFIEDAALYDRTCHNVRPVPRTCRAQHARLRARAAALVVEMDAAEDIGRRGWLAPGEAREIARGQGLDDLPGQLAGVMAEPVPSVMPPESTVSRRRPRR